MSTPEGLAARRRRRVVTVVVAGSAVVLLGMAWVLGREAGAGAVAALLGLVVVVGVIAALLLRSDRRRRRATGPADPAQRVEPRLDVERVRARRAQGGPVAATREVRRQAAWLSLGEAADLADGIG